MGEVSTIGLDLAKQVFHAHGADASGAPMFSRLVQSANKITGSATFYSATVTGTVKGDVDGFLNGNHLRLRVKWFALRTDCHQVVISWCTDAQYKDTGVYEASINENGELDGLTYPFGAPSSRSKWYSRPQAACADILVMVPPIGPAVPSRNREAPQRTPYRPAPILLPPIASEGRCKSGYVWRESTSDDRVCVTPESRERVRVENRLAEIRRDPTGAYGPNSCKSGFVWREAYEGDVVCVEPEVRALVKQETADAAGNRI